MVLFLPFSLFSQSECKIDGWVFDAATKYPIPSVNVTVRGTSIGVPTDSTGYFRLELSVGEQYVLVFSSLGYKKQVKNLSLEKSKEVEYRIYLIQEAVALNEVVVTGKKSFEDIRGLYFIDGIEFERLGEDDMEKALIYFFPDIVHPIKDRMKVSSPLHKLTPFEKLKKYEEEELDFTLYVNKEWKETTYLDQIDPYSIKYIQVWDAKGIKDSPELRNDMSPVGLDLKTGKYVVHIVTK
jgi:hypothetical protein